MEKAVQAGKKEVTNKKAALKEVGASISIRLLQR
jgi:hypothetical protein